MTILCTHPGRYGDLLWALPTVRAISESAHEPVDLLLSPRYAAESFRKLVGRQSYIGEVIVGEDWEIVEGAPITPREPPTIPRTADGSGYDQVVHLAYDGWPRLTLPWETYRIAEPQVPLAPLNLEKPWIAAPFLLEPHRVAVGFSGEHFELKYGLYWLVRNRFTPNGERNQVLNLCGGARWSDHGYTCGWEEAASWMVRAHVFVGCCSALHVLACAVGTPVVMIEPNPMRHHEIFYPYGQTSLQVWLVQGNDKQPTVDSRHLIDAVVERLSAVRKVIA